MAGEQNKTACDGVSVSYTIPYAVLVTSPNTNVSLELEPISTKKSSVS